MNESSWLKQVETVSRLELLNVRRSRRSPDLGVSLLAPLLLPVLLSFVFTLFAVPTALSDADATS